jgi:amino acid transporter
VNLGLAPGLIAAASLMVGYIATVAVSVSSGVAAITSAFPSLYDQRVWISVGLVALMALTNLRGVRESGRIFAVPTYLFVLLCGGMVVVGFVRWLMGDLHTAPVHNVEAAQTLTAFLVLRAFAGGCAAMTGTEAIANAVPAFKPPESRNAARTLGTMAALLGFLLMGVTLLARYTGVIHLEKDTVLSQIGRLVYGGSGAGTILYYALQVATMAILVLGANTCYAGFPRLSSVMARDGMMPRQFMNRGDRLVFSNGIVGLTIAAIIIIVAFKAETHRMIPFYALGVFIGFTLSQTGMVVHWYRLRSRGWLPRAAMNALGALLTGVVSVVLLITKFTDGAYIVVALVPLFVGLFYWVRGHYLKVARVLEPQSGEELEELGLTAHAVPRSTAVVFVAQANSLTARALAIARALSPGDLRVVTISSNPEQLSRLQDTWVQIDVGIPLIVVDSPYREFVRPAVDYVRSLNPSPRHWVSVVIPQFVVEHWWENFLHNQDAFRLKTALLRVPWVGVMSVPLHIGAVSAGAVGKPPSELRQEKRAPARKAARRGGPPQGAEGTEESDSRAKNKGGKQAGGGAKKG